jgi:hypothetical protein
MSLRTPDRRDREWGFDAKTLSTRLSPVTEMLNGKEFATSAAQLPGAR